MNLVSQQYFPLFFVGIWVAVTILSGFLTGWYALMRQYPDRPEDPLLKLRWQSGSMGLSIRLNGILTLSACPSGLRVGMLRLFGIFCRDFFVPWGEISVTRRARFFRQVAELQFGSPPAGRLTLSTSTVDDLRRAAGSACLEQGPLTEETREDAFRRLATMWLAYTVLASAFYFVVPRLLSSDGGGPPVAVAILFPATVFGLVFLVRYFVEIRRQG